MCTTCECVFLKLQTDTHHRYTMRIHGQGRKGKQRQCNTSRRVVKMYNGTSRNQPLTIAFTSRRSESTSRCGFTLLRPYPSSSPRQHTPVPTHVYARTRVLLATERAIAHATCATFSISNLALLLASSSSCDSRAASACTASPSAGVPRRRAEIAGPPAPARL